MTAPAVGTGPLAGTRVLEFEGLGPAPYAGMLLADLGCDVVRIGRLDGPTPFSPSGSPLDRGRRVLSLDLKALGAVETCLTLIEKADVLIEGFRPGVMERIGLGPDKALERNPRLIYGRMTGWGQTGPLAGKAGHDLTYLALTGALAAMGPPDRHTPPSPPLQVIGDMGGGGAFLVMGVLAALLERERSGKGQVIDAAIVDGVASQLALILGLRASGVWDRPRGHNLLDGGAPFYRCYTCSDGKFIAAGALETKFYAALLQGLGLDPGLVATQYDEGEWPRLHVLLEDIFGRETRDEWVDVFAGLDACVAPVLDFDEAAAHLHNRTRDTYRAIEGALHPLPAPRFSRSLPVECEKPQATTAPDVLLSWSNTNG